MLKTTLAAFVLLLLVVAGCSHTPTEPESPPGDRVPPAQITNLKLVSTTPSRVTLSWTTPGNDSISGQAFMYDARYSTQPLNDSTWGSASQWQPYFYNFSEPGEVVSYTITHLRSNTTYHFALMAVDGYNNWSSISNVVTVTTQVDSAFEWIARIPNVEQYRLFACENGFLYTTSYSSVGRWLQAFDVRDPLTSNPTPLSTPISCPSSIVVSDGLLYSLSQCCTTGECAGRYS